MEDIGGEMSRLALFIVTVMVGLIIHAFIILPLIFFVVRRTNPFKFMYGMKDAFMTAFGISSRLVVRKSDDWDSAPVTENCPPSRSKDHSSFSEHNTRRGGEHSHTLPIRVCAAQRGRDFEAPGLEQGIHFRGVF